MRSDAKRFSSDRVARSQAAAGRRVPNLPQRCARRGWQGPPPGELVGASVKKTARQTSVPRWRTDTNDRPRDGPARTACDEDRAPSPCASRRMERRQAPCRCRSSGECRRNRKRASTRTGPPDAVAACSQTARASRPAARLGLIGLLSARKRPAHPVAP